MSGPCAKRHVECRINVPHPSGEEEWVIGTNSCENPQATCPRLPSDGYDKCVTICGQRGHAEESALRLAREAGIDVRGGTATITGHYWICEKCGSALMAAGISKVVIIVPQVAAAFVRAAA
jgi:deoxycytidylate deaminase